MLNANYNYTPTASSNGPSQFVGNPDLLFLREDLADEAGAIIGYLECAREVKERRISRFFREVVRDEQGHYASLLQLIASLDPVQAEELAKQELTQYAMVGYDAQSAQGIQGMQARQAIPGLQGRSVGNMACQTCQQQVKYFPGEDEDEPPKKHFRPFERDLECLRNAIRDELHAINAYQKQISTTNNPTIQNMLLPIMNQEKAHVAGYTKLWLELLNYQNYYPRD